MSQYAAFLETKRRRVHDAGVGVHLSDVHPTLFPFQRDIVVWALRKGRAAIFADTGLGKTLMQLEWARLTGQRTLIIAPLAVAQQTIREAQKVGLNVTYARDMASVEGGLTITNYEMADRFDPSEFGAVVLDESSILKAHDRPTSQRLIQQWRHTPWRLACTATPAPNDEEELGNHAEFLGVLPRAEFLASYFVHDEEGWRLKGHAVEPMFEWMATWAVALRRPSDLGYDDTGYVLPPLRIIPEVVDVALREDGALFPTSLGGVGGRHRVRRDTLAARVERTVELATDDQPWIVWCGLNEESRAATAAIDGAVEVAGSMTPEEKADRILAFCRGEFRVLVTKCSIAGYGLNLQHCARMAFTGLSDSYESYYQAIRRCYRFGQRREVAAHIVISGLERQIVENVQRKEGQARTVTDGLVRHVARAFQPEAA